MYQGASVLSQERLRLPTQSFIIFGQRCSSLCSSSSSGSSQIDFYLLISQLNPRLKRIQVSLQLANSLINTSCYGDNWCVVEGEIIGVNRLESSGTDAALGGIQLEFPWLQRTCRRPRWWDLFSLRKLWRVARILTESKVLSINRHSRLDVCWCRQMLPHINRSSLSCWELN